MSDSRFLIDFNTGKMECKYYDVVVIGSGIAGVYTALEMDEEINIAIITKDTIDISNSVLAQGGIAVSLDNEDSPKLHFKDTIYAGDGLCDEESVWLLVNEAKKNIKNLSKYGVDFDRCDKGKLSLSREGAHSKNRIVHAGDTTGKEVCDKLISVVKNKKNVEIFERHFVIDLVTENDICKGVLIFDEDNNNEYFFRTNIVICASGGYGQIYKNTTNPEIATGDGIAMAYRANAELMDLEFIQFHPTVFYHEKNKDFLISEAVRGEGAVIRSGSGERFMEKYHEMGDLAPRDIVSRAIFMEMSKTKVKNVFLDISFKDEGYVKNRFPNIYKTCLEYGIDITKQYIPISPAEHYCMGGIKADKSGYTNIKGFFACGEVACNGIHGANRLASNSLLEGLVFGSKIGSIVNQMLSELKNDKPKNNKEQFEFCSNRLAKDIDRESTKNSIKSIMTEYVGIIRDEKGLNYAMGEIEKYYVLFSDMKNESVADYELQNIITISKLVIQAAFERQESRGGHYRADFSSCDNEKWKKHIIKCKYSNGGRLDGKV